MEHTTKAGTFYLSKMKIVRALVLTQDDLII